METVRMQCTTLADQGFVSGQSAPLQALRAMVEELAPTDIPILLIGESGTGKEVYARVIHGLSGENGASLKKINCATIESLQLQNELPKQIAHDGGCGKVLHLFLDGIDELDPVCQKQLLAFLTDGEQGSNRLASRVRIISATTRELEKEVESGKFRRELYFRINGACLRLPPLRERKEDIKDLLEHFLQKHEQDLNSVVPSVDQETLNTLMAYDWPGNIRELENLARKMVALGNARLAANDLRVLSRLQPQPSTTQRCSSLKVAAREASRQRERELILEALQRTKWNRKRAAQELQISYKALLYKLKQIGAPETSTHK
jgi:two-component system response regulator AtoC